MTTLFFKSRFTKFIFTSELTQSHPISSASTPTYHITRYIKKYSNSGRSDVLIYLPNILFGPLSLVIRNPQSRSIVPGVRRVSMPPASFNKMDHGL